MALALQISYCSIREQRFSYSELMDDTFMFIEGNRDERTNSHKSGNLCGLIRTHESAIKKAGISGCLCVLLPPIPVQSSLKNFVCELLTIIGQAPSLEVYLYPYGEPSFLMALSRIQRELDAVRPTWILALNAEIQDNENSHDSVILAVCSEQSSGLTLGNVRVDLDSVKPNLAVEKVVNQLGVGCQKQFSDLSFTIDGEEPIWMYYLSCLYPWIAPSTRYLFANLKFGSLGACNGLLKTLSLYHQQKQCPNSAFQALQFDIEPSGYVAGVLFGWSAE